MPIERHPWEPYVPDGARILIMGTFPPQPKRWSMDFYYPNRTNDFWPMMGLIFMGNRRALLAPDGKAYDLEAIKRLLTERRIALHDTGRAVRRLQGNASDKYLEVVEPVDLAALLASLPDCRDLATTGEKAATVLAGLTDSLPPRMGEYIHATYLGRPLRIWRMPSSSRAYPLALDKKAAYYATLFRSVGIL